jgi:cellobiose phosphorylase
LSHTFFKKYPLQYEVLVDIKRIASQYASTVIMVSEDMWKRSPTIILNKILFCPYTTQTIEANLTKIIRLQKEESDKFLNRYHHMGATNDHFKYGIVYKTMLIGVFILSKARTMKYEIEEPFRSIELVRYCTLPQIRIQGGLSKIIKNTLLVHQVSHIITHIDPMLDTGYSYYACGFSYKKHTHPNIFLIDTNNNRRKKISIDVAEKLDLKTNLIGFDLGSLVLEYNSIKKNV